MGESFRLTVRSEMISVTGGTPFDTAPGVLEDEDGEPISLSPKKDKVTKERDVLEMTALASLTEGEDSRICLRYDDAVDPDEPPVETCISFDPAMPELVTLERHGVIRSVMMFQEGQYRRCEYVTPFMTFEMCVYARKVDNRLTASGGTLTLDYSVEIKGAAAQRVKMELEAVRI